jgi:hypothetical protein
MDALGKSVQSSCGKTIEGIHMLLKQNPEPTVKECDHCFIKASISAVMRLKKKP